MAVQGEEDNDHWDDVALQGVFIGADLEGDLHGVLDSKNSGVVEPLDLVGVML